MLVMVLVAGWTYRQRRKTQMSIVVQSQYELRVHGEMG